MLHRLRIKNWKSHRDSQLNFRKGTNLFVGIMGSGKTSVMDAISFALFGTFPGLKSRRVKIEDVIMSRPSLSAGAEVELEFDLGGKTYLVRRSISRKEASSAQVFCDGKLLEAQPQRATELVEGILGTDYDLFSRVIYAEQNRIDALLTTAKGDRKRQVDELLGLIRFETVRAQAGALLNVMKGKKAVEEGVLSGIDAAGLESQVLEAQATAEGFSQQILLAKTSLETAALQLQTAQTQLSALEEKERKVRQLEKTLEGITALLASRESEIAAALAEHEPALEERDYLALQAASKIAEGNVQAAGQTVALRQKESLALQVSLSEALRRQKEHQRARQEWTPLQGAGSARVALQEQIQAASVSLATLLVESAELQRAISTLQQASAACPTCNAPLSQDQHRTVQSQKQERLAALEKKIKELEAQKKALQAQAVSVQAQDNRRLLLEAQMAQPQLTAQEMAGLEEKNAQAQQKLMQAQQDLQKLQEDAQSASKSLQAAQKAREKAVRMAQWKSHAEELRDKKAHAEGELKTLDYSPIQVASGRDQWAKQAQLHAAAQEALRALQNQAQSNEKTLKQLQERRKDVEKRMAAVKAWQAKAEKAARFQRSVVETQKLLREELITALNATMEQVWDVLYPYKDYSSIRLFASEDDYALEVRTPEGNWTGIENCSGGERSCAALSLRVAFAMVLAPGMSWLILDEPTHNLDRNAVSRLSQVLREQLPSIVEQTFIVTHDESLKEGASATVFFFEREKESGGATDVEALSALSPQSET